MQTSLDLQCRAGCLRTYYLQIIMASIADDKALPDHIKSDHNVRYDPVKEEETDEDEEVGKPISHHHHPPIIKKEETDDEELGSNHPEVYIQAEDTDDEFSEYDLLVNTFRVSVWRTT